jgi:putative ATP-dependent endonuclease of OLD family
LAESELEPQESDFYAFEDTERIQILIQFNEVHEECVVAKFREHVSDDGVLYIAYEGKRGRSAKEKNYKILLGKSPDALKEIEGRFYLRVLNLKFMDSSLYAPS